MGGLIGLIGGQRGGTPAAWPKANGGVCGRAAGPRRWAFVAAACERFDAPGCLFAEPFRDACMAFRSRSHAPRAAGTQGALSVGRPTSRLWAGSRA